MVPHNDADCGTPGETTKDVGQLFLWIRLVYAINGGLRNANNTRRGHDVWESDGEPYGWWLGIIAGIDKNDFIIRWPDDPKTPPLKMERKHVATLLLTLG